MTTIGQTVGVRHLKARLSRYLQRVRAGERLIVTDRGRPVASLTPIDPPRSLDWIHAMAAEGRARWGGGKPRGAARPARVRGTPASRIVIEDRR